MDKSEIYPDLKNKTYENDPVLKTKYSDFSPNNDNRSTTTLDDLELLNSSIKRMPLFRQVADPSVFFNTCTCVQTLIPFQDECKEKNPIDSSTFKSVSIEELPIGVHQTDGSIHLFYVLCNGLRVPLDINNLLCTKLSCTDKICNNNCISK